MLRSLNDLEGFAIHATDGKLGHVKDFYFDDQAWVMRYFVVDTGTWLLSRQVLISPISVGQPDWENRVLPVSLTQAQVKNSPDIDTNKPVSRQHELDYFGYYGYPFYWGGTDIWGGGIYPGTLLPGYLGVESIPLDESAAEEADRARADAAQHAHDDPHLRSYKALLDYHIAASDGDIGHVQGLLVDEASWAIKYLIVNTNNWWLGHQMLIAPQLIKAVSWSDASVTLDMTRQAVKDAPLYDASIAGASRI
jgi:uncharacterized protein YrrD